MAEGSVEAPALEEKRVSEKRTETQKIRAGLIEKVTLLLQVDSSHPVVPSIRRLPLPTAPPAPSDNRSPTNCTQLG